MSSNASRSKSPMPSRSKKRLNLTPKSNAQNSNSLTNLTPDKPEPPRRSRRGFAFSLKEVKEAAQSLREPTQDRIYAQKGQIKSARRPILSCSDENTACESNKAEAGVSIKLPEKYEMLGEFFDGLDSSIRLSRMRGSTPTFRNICLKVETLTERRLTHSHLAQMKFILPEAIELKKTLVFDERTSCMKPDIHVTLNVDAIEVDEKLKCGGKNIHLRKVFRARLLDFFKAHPEGDEVPEEALPEPFHSSKQGLASNMFRSPKSPLPSEPSVNVNSEEQTVVGSHLPKSFQSRFLKRNSISKAENSCQELSSVSFQPRVSPALDHTDSTAISPAKISSEPTNSSKGSAFEGSPVLFSPSRLPATPSKPLDSVMSEDSSCIDDTTLQSTPAKQVVTPAKFMSITPVTPAVTPALPLKRSRDGEQTTSSEKLVRRAPRTLKFDTPKKSERVKDEAKEVEQSSFDKDIYDILSGSIIQSIREKERKTLEEQDPAITQAKRRKEMISSLPKLFSMIHFTFQSRNGSVITKEELMHKIIVGHCDVVDRREVEEQLKLLLELVPEWIYEKQVSSGDSLLCIKKTTSPECIRARLEQAK